MCDDLKLKITGVKNETHQFSQEITDDFEIFKSYKLTSDRAESQSFTENIDQDIIIQLTTDDGLEWIGYGDDLPDIMAISEKDRSEDFIHVPENFYYQDKDRNILKIIKNRVK